MWKFSPRKLSIFLLMTFQTAGFITMVMKLHLKNSTPVVSKPERSHLLIISSWRSGSSFTGQLFSQHPDVFYLMEPGWHVWVRMNQNRIEVLHMAIRDMIRSLFNCDMSVYDAYIPIRENKSQLFQWETSRALCSPPACYHFKRSDIVPQLSCKALCSNFPFDTVQKSCRSYNNIVIKEVRVFDLKVLYPLLHDPTLNLKILHLVRDPRAIFQSRTKVTTQLSHDSNILLRGANSKQKDNSYKAIERVCKSQAEIYETALSGIPGNNNYMMVRYEDIVQDPLGKAKEMFEFAKLSVTPKLENWIQNMTRGKGRGYNFIISSRDALNTSKAWRTQLPFDDVQKVQNICWKALALFGYRTLHSISQQNDLSLETALPMS